MVTCDHLVEFSSSDDTLVEHAADFLADGFAQDCTCIAIITNEHRLLIENALEKRQQQPQTLLANNRYIVLDAEQALESLVVDGEIDDLKFHRTFGELLRLAGAGGRFVRIAGEMSSLLARRGHPKDVIHLEELWNDLSRDHTFAAYCMYPAALFASSRDETWRESLGAIHSRSLTSA